MKKSTILGLIGIAAAATTYSLVDTKNIEKIDAIPAVVRTTNESSQGLEGMVGAAKEKESHKLEELFKITLERHRDEEFVKEHGPMFQYVKNPTEIRLSEINDFVIALSPEWCVACREAVPGYQKLFEERYIRRKNQPAMAVFKSLNDNLNDSFENFYQSLGVKRFPTYAIAQRDNAGEVKLVFVNLKGDAGVGSLERDIDKVLYGIDHGSAFVEPILKAIYDNCDPVIDALTSEKLPEINILEKGRPIINWDLSIPSHFSLALHHDLNSKGVHAYYLDRLKKEIWLKTNEEPNPALPEELVEHLFRTYFPKEKAERLIKDKSAWRKYFAVGSDEPPSKAEDLTLMDILGYDYAGIFIKPDPTDSHYIPTVSGENHYRMLEDIKAWQKALSQMNDHNIPTEIKRHWDSYLADSRGKYDGTANRYRFPRAVSNDFKKEMEKFRQEHGIEVKYFDLPSDTDLEKHVDSLSLTDKENGEYSECLVTARDKKQRFYEKFGEYFIPRDTPYQVLESMIASKELSLVSGVYFDAQWNKEFDLMLQRNKNAIDRGQLGIFTLEFQEGKLGPFPPYKAGIGYSLLAYGLPPGAIIVKSDLSHIASFSDYGHLRAIDEKFIK